MRVKKYVVDSMPSALQKIRLDLGDNAVILNTKEIRTGGFMGIFSKRQIEVVAAVPAEKEIPKIMPETRKEKPLNPPTVSPTLEAEVMKELRGMKEMLAGMMTGDGDKERIPQPLIPWVQRLKEQEVDRQVIQFFIEQLMRSSPSLIQEEIEKSLLLHLKKLIAEGSLEEPTIDRSVNLVSFVGPTGVGKTTTIAKLASEQVLHHNRRVGLLTTDTYRIAAVEQLKTYANILNIPIETVFSPDALKKAIKNLQDCDLILMDTTGRNYQEQHFIEEIGKYLLEPLVQENYLVLSMTAKYSDITKIVDNFGSVPIDKIIMTKFDETSSYGSLVNLIYHYPYPLAYLTTGQNVPEDIVKVVPERLAKLMLGVAPHDHGSSPTP